MIAREQQARTSGTSVSVGGRPLCSTANSRSLDPVSFPQSFAVKEWVADRIALCWNACRHLSDDQLLGDKPVEADLLRELGYIAQWGELIGGARCAEIARKAASAQLPIDRDETANQPETPQP